MDISSLKNYVEKEFAQLGPNKRQEVTRLLFEISKRENNPFEQILRDAPKSKSSRRFSELKEYLQLRRFPNISKQKNLKQRYLAVDIDAANQMPIKSKLHIDPKNFIVEESVRESNLVQRLKNKFPHANFEFTSGIKNLNHNKESKIKDYNNRLETFYIVKEHYDFYKPCPCSNKSVSCGYHNVNLGSGCGFECTYCYLQDYINAPGITIPANLEDFFEKFKEYNQNVRVGSGELTDSLIFDHITEFSIPIVKFFKNYPQSSFEFKTKSDNVDNLLRISPANNVVVGWSINPQTVIDSVEFYTASLEQRLTAAKKVMAAGYKLAFHFDPIIYYANWENDYKNLVDEIFDRIKPESIEWISLGTLRMTANLKKIIENRFPGNTILDEEFYLSYDGKFRYALDLRTKMYTQIKKWIQERAPKNYIYLCMEEKLACQQTSIFPTKPKMHKP